MDEWMIRLDATIQKIRSKGLEPSMIYIDEETIKDFLHPVYRIGQEHIEGIYGAWKGIPVYVLPNWDKKIVDVAVSIGEVKL